MEKDPKAKEDETKNDSENKIVPGQPRKPKRNPGFLDGV